MGPGPSNPDPRVLAAMSKRLVGHLDPYFVELMDQAMGALREVYRTANHHTLPISATGSGGLEAIMMNLLEPGDGAVVCITGYFGQRLAELAARAGADVRVVEVPPAEIVDPAEVERLLEAKPAKLVAFVHLETTTGACQPIEPMVAVARRHGALTVMDCVTSLGGMPIEVVGGPARLKLGQLEGRAAMRFAHWHDGSPDRVLAAWVVRAAAGTTVDVVARHERAGQSAVVITLA
jgi:alanine-glyoxylate transaminase/serine-glyoxylate transaminase/serine-pyruvate transaminase